MLEFRKDIFADERDDNLHEIGQPTQRQDMLGHVTGTSPYYDDHRFANLLHLKILRSPHAHARIRSIDDSAAARAPGVKRIIRAADVPVNLNTLLSLIQFGKDDEPSLATDVVRYKGEPILGIVATSERAAHEAMALVRISYDQLPAVFDVEEAIKPGAPSVNAAYPKNTFEYYGKYDHQKLRYGDADAAFAQADIVLDERYQMSPIEHAPTETNGSIAVPDTNGRFVVYTSTQALFFSLDTAAKINAVPSNQLHFIGGTVGGGFGGKVDTMTEPLSILAARLTGSPVRYRFSRHEEMQFGSPRGGERIYVKDGIMQRWPHRRPHGARLFRQRRLYAAVELRGRQMRSPHSRTLHDPECLGRRVLRVHQSHAGNRHARLRRHRARFRARMPDGQGRHGHRHGPARIPHSQRLPRRRHESASPRGEELRADRMRAGRGREGQLAAARRVPQNVVAARRRRSAHRRRGRSHARAGAGSPDTRTGRHAAARILRTADAGCSAPIHSAACAAAAQCPAAPRVARRIDAWCAALFFSLRHQEALTMAKHRGRGVATINYPIGMNLGGDPSQALVHSNPTGKFTVALSSIDLGQGMKSVTRQICAETLGVPVEDVYVDTADSDTGPHCMGSFASRGTHRVGNAVMVAAREARAVMMEAAAEELEVDPGDLETDGKGSIRVKGAPHRSISVRDVAIAAQFRQGKTISGRGIFLVPLSDVDPETGEMSPATCYAHACLIAEVEVDDETGDVAVLKMTSSYEIGRALNPKLVEQQLVGGAWMGMSHALYETPEPYYPDPRDGPRDFNEYLMPGPGDICPHDIIVLERPAPDGPFGAKGPGEMCANPVLPAVANAIFNAVGVRIDDLPITPEKVLRALKARGGAAATRVR